MHLEKIKQPFIKEFPGDFSGNPYQRQTPDVLFCTVNPVQFPKPELLIFNKALSEEIGLGNLNPEDYNFLFAQNLPENIQPYSTNYAGHQFGNWAGQLGDGRAIFAGEITNTYGKKTEIQWKGAGATPYSRNADGRAVLRSSLREYLMSEAMQYLNIPTTRALSLSFTGENVIRDMLYNGNPNPEQGAVVVRTAESFLRFGHFELLSATKNTSILKKLADFTIEHYFPEIKINSETKYLDWFKKISEKTANLMVEWFRVGFVHGVMNTDNLSILGLTIDYGPFSMLDEYDLNFTPNTTDIPGKRYAFGQQAKIAQWNLWQLANAIFPLINDEKAMEQVINNFGNYFWQKHDEMMCRKFGFDELLEQDQRFFTEWQQMMQDLKIDYTLFFTKLEEYIVSEEKEIFEECFYLKPNSKDWERLEVFLINHTNRMMKNKISKEESLMLMRKNNPKFILRNYLLFECIEELKLGKRNLLDQLLLALKTPYQDPQKEFQNIRPAHFNQTIGASMLSCSS